VIDRAFYSRDTFYSIFAKHLLNRWIEMIVDLRLIWVREVTFQACVESFFGQLGRDRAYFSLKVALLELETVFQVEHEEHKVLS